MATRRQMQRFEIKEFSNPYTGLAAMILTQANDDLERLGSRESGRLDGVFASKTEITCFFRSSWGSFLASSCGVADENYNRYVEAL